MLINSLITKILYIKHRLVKTLHLKEIIHITFLYDIIWLIQYHHTSCVVFYSLPPIKYHKIIESLISVDGSRVHNKIFGHLNRKLFSMWQNKNYGISSPTRNFKRIYLFITTYKENTNFLCGFWIFNFTLFINHLIYNVILIYLIK